MAALPLGPGEHELLLGELPGPHHARLLPEDLDQRGTGIRVVADLVEHHGPVGDGDAAGEARLLHGGHDRVGIGGRGALQHVADHLHRLVGVGAAGVEVPSVGALGELGGDLLHRSTLVVRPRRGVHDVLDQLLQLLDLAGLVEAGGARADHAHDVQPLLGDLLDQRDRGHRTREGRDHVGLGRPGARDLGGEIGGGLRERNDLDNVEAGVSGLVGGLEAGGGGLAEEVVGIHHDHALGADVGLAEDVGHVLDGVLAEGHRAGEVAVDVLDLLLALTHRLGDVGGDRIGGGDVDQVRHPPLLGQRRDGRDVRGVESAGHHLGASAHQPLGLRARDLDLGLAVGQQQLQLRAAHRLDAARGVDRLRGQLRAQPAVSADLGHGAADRADNTDLDRLRLSVERPGQRDGTGRSTGQQEKVSATDAARDHRGPSGPRWSHVCAPSASGRLRTS